MILLICLCLWNRVVFFLISGKICVVSEKLSRKFDVKSGRLYWLYTKASKKFWYMLAHAHISFCTSPSNIRATFNKVNIDNIVKSGHHHPIFFLPSIYTVSVNKNPKGILAITSPIQLWPWNKVMFNQEDEKTQIKL